jgi:hypothetical protein
VEILSGAARGRRGHLAINELGADMREGLIGERREYSAPEVSDLGTLLDMTAACVGAGPNDESFKGPFSFVSPAFGDPDFCTP